MGNVHSISRAAWKSDSQGSHNFMTISYLNHCDAPEPAGLYSQATYSGGLLFISGQLPIGCGAPETNGPRNASFPEQAARALRNMLAILNGCGGSIENLARVTAYIVGVEHWSEFDRIYAEIIGPRRPARAVVPVSELHHGYMIEVEAIAVEVPDRKSEIRLSTPPAAGG